MAQPPFGLRHHRTFAALRESCGEALLGEA
jgi:hypothetical protein